jgi:hypothetical protein
MGSHLFAVVAWGVCGVISAVLFYKDVVKKRGRFFVNLKVVLVSAIFIPLGPVFFCYYIKGLEKRFGVKLANFLASFSAVFLSSCFMLFVTGKLCWDKFFSFVLPFSLIYSYASEYVNWKMPKISGEKRSIT